MTYYIIEYIRKGGGKIKQLEKVETLDDTFLYIKEHHLMTRRIYKTWFPNLKWESKTKPVFKEVEIDKECDTFVNENKNIKIVPTKHLVACYWYREPLDKEYNFKGYERYNVYEIKIKE